MENRPTLGIVGTGISGLGAAYYLRDRFQITLFEKEDRAGGHTHTHHIETPDAAFPVDTGFIVFNHTTYPRLTRLFDELGVESADSDMSFSLYNRNNNLQFCGKSLRHLFAQKRRLFSPRYLHFLWQAHRFNTRAPRHLEAGVLDDGISFERYLEQEGYSDYFKFNFIIPMGSAVWSTPIEKMLQFPARTFIRFFVNHGFLGLDTQLQWRYVRGGSHTYTRKILEQLPDALRLPEAVQSVERTVEQGRSGVRVVTTKGRYRFDYVLIAAHADQALAMLSDARPFEREILSAFPYESNRAILHTDAAVMPPLKQVWSAWNYKRDAHERTTTIYHMNALQKLPTHRDYFVSINEIDPIDPDKIIRIINYEHPLFDTRSIQMQQRLPELNNGGPLFFAGAYFRYGFHEDGLLAALQAVDAIRNAHARIEHSNAPVSV
ncbi:MAG: FAD-dependent oxidoreductase [Leptospiraceae bacterium]|nr:FAD-dependent oxidoreductase [Leptospiraceae bacterium]